MEAVTEGDQEVYAYSATPGATKVRRVRRRAVTVFRAAAERRTVGRTGILIYLSMGERRAEIVADEAILKVTDAHTWGEAMTALLVEVRAGRPGDGIVAAIERVRQSKPTSRTCSSTSFKTQIRCRAKSCC